jgi:hypothetical protein
MAEEEISHLDKYIEIKNLTSPLKVFERLDNEFIDIMYQHHFTETSVIMLLDVNIDPSKEKDILWLKQLLDSCLLEIGETDFFLTAFNPIVKG